LLRKQEATSRHDVSGQGRMDGRMNGVQTTWKHRHCTIEGRPMGRRIDAPGQTAHHSATSLLPILGHLRRPPHATGTTCARTHHGKSACPGLVARKPSQPVQHGWGVVNFPQQRRIGWIRPQNHPPSQGAQRLDLLIRPCLDTHRRRRVFRCPTRPSLNGISNRQHISPRCLTPPPRASQQRHPSPRFRPSFQAWRHPARNIPCYPTRPLHAHKETSSSHRVFRQFMVGGRCFAHDARVWAMCRYLVPCVSPFSQR
jgi:hypothetical protein